MKNRNLPAKIKKAVPAKASPAMPEVKTPMDLLRLVTTGGANIEVIERITALYEKSEAQRKAMEFHDAMAALQSRLPTITKTKCVYRSEDKGGQLLYKFADLADIVKAIAPLEKEFGFHHRFDFAERQGGGCKCTCIVTHRAGHSESTTVSIPPTKGMNTNAAQDNGIEMTYGQRYAIIGAYGITTADEDRDANTGTCDTITPAQAKTIADMVKASETDLARFLGWLGVASIEAIPAARFEDAVTQLNKKLDQALAKRGAK